MTNYFNTVKCDVNNNEQGSVLFFILAMIMIISGVVYYYFDPYRIAVGDFMASSIRTEGVMNAYSIERTLSIIIPRMDLNIYRTLHNLPPWSPVFKKIPFKNDTINVQIMSMNNCINISALDDSERTVKNNRLNKILDNLAYHLLGKRNQGSHLALVLMASKLTNDGGSELFHSQYELSAEQRNLRARVAPFVCHRTNGRQLININAISPTQFPVLLAILPDEITENDLQAVWKKKDGPWKSTEDFIHAILPSGSLPSFVRDELLVSDEEIQVSFSWKNKKGDVFYMSDIFLLDGDKMTLISRHLFQDDDIR
ncbi:general secretion pathway protein GspK [Salmonella enterica]